jgi:magnesium-transporting ATPase (P-type)
MVKVIRGGQKLLVENTEVVCGDLLMLDTGDKIIADGILIETFGLIIDEASLTGESDPIKKNVEEDPWCRCAEGRAWRWRCFREGSRRPVAGGAAAAAGSGLGWQRSARPLLLARLLAGGTVRAPAAGGGARVRRRSRRQVPLVAVGSIC